MRVLSSSMTGPPSSWSARISIRKRASAGGGALCQNPKSLRGPRRPRRRRAACRSFVARRRRPHRQLEYFAFPCLEITAEPGDFPCLEAAVVAGLQKCQLVGEHAIDEQVASRPFAEVGHLEQILGGQVLVLRLGTVDRQ